MTFIRNLFRRYPLPRQKDPSPAPGGIRGGRRSVWFFGILLLVLATALATRGRYWSLSFHPDEPTIREWIDQVRDKGYIVDRAYPSGWFELFRIRFFFEKESAKISNDWNEHSIQNGKVVAIHEPTFFRSPETVPEKPPHTVQDGRDFNTWLYVLSVLFLYAACLEAGFRPVAAFVSGLFYLAAPAPVEFIHYCETDAALLVSMTFFAWLSARALRRRSAPLTVLAALAAGFAVSCKFTLFPLLLWCAAGPATALRRPDDPPARRFARTGGVILLALVAAAAGYVLGTPALRHDPSWYMEALRHASDGTYAEIAINLDGNYSWSAATVLRANALLRNFAGRGIVPVLWGFVAWSFWFRRPFRRQLAGIPFLLPLFIPFLVCGCPFVRHQETLPFDVLFAFGAGLPLTVWLDALAAGAAAPIPPPCPARRFVFALVALLGLAAFARQASQALGMASCFALRDTRAEAQNWLHDSLPADEPLFLDAYVGQVARGVPCRPCGYGGLPFRWKGVPPEENGIPARYYVENVGFEARLPIRDPKNGALFPDIRRNVAAYENDVLTLRQWAVAPGTPVPTFGQPPVRLVAFDRPGPDSFDVPIGHDRPIRLLPDGVHLYDADGLPSLGPRRAIRSVCKRSTVHLDLADGPRWLVTLMLDGDIPVRVAREGLFLPKTDDLPPRGAAVAELSPTLWNRLAARASAYSSMRCRIRGDDHAAFCATFLASTPAEAARVLRLAGRPADALALLRRAAPLDAEARVEAFLAADAAGLPPEPGWTAAAHDALAAADRLAALPQPAGRADATLCGVPLGVAGDFARIRTGRVPIVPGGALPVWLPPGRYDLVLTLPSTAPVSVPARLFDGQTADLSVATGENGEWRLSTSLDLSAPALLRARGDPEAEPPFFLPFAAGVEIAWSPVEHTLDAARALRDALRRSAPDSNPAQPQAEK